jgi:hypothetical protein
VSYTNRFEDEVETGLQMPSVYFERGYSVKSEGDGIFIDPSPDTPTTGKVIKRKIYHKTGFISDADVIGDYTLIHTFADDTAYADTVAVFDGFEDGATYGVPPFTLAQSWEEADEANLLLDTYTGAAGAYSLRKLRTLYTGDAVEVYNGSSYADIGFSNDELDTTALAAHCGSNDGFIRTWYDQGTNGNDATQSTTANMPKIYDGTTGVVTENGKPAVEFDGSDDNFTSTISNITQSFDVYTVHNFNTTPAATERLYDSDNGGRITRGSNSTSNNFAFAGTVLSWSPQQTGQVQETTVYSGVSSLVRVNGTQTASGDAGTNSTGTDLVIGADKTASSQFIDGQIQEFIIFDNSKNATDRSGIETNIATFYDITI